MDWLTQIAQWVREAVAGQAWLAWLEPHVERAPDWALVAPAPVLVVLALVVFARRKSSPRRDRERHEAATPDQGRPPAYAKASAGKQGSPLQGQDDPLSAPADADPTGLSRRRDAGGPDEDGSAVRVFVSSTFLDMQRERDVLVRQTFPALRARFRARGVELLEVDLRWGVTREQAESGAALSICLSEIDRCRPYFIGLIGERYGWIPPEALFTEAFDAAFPVVAGARGCSITEIEVLHGVLSDAKTARNALFFMRDPAWIETLSPEERGEYVADDPALEAKHAHFKARIEASGARVASYKSPEEIGAAVELALGRALETRFADAAAPDAFTQTERLHAAYARERRGLHVGAEPCLGALDQWVAETGAPPLAITGASGGGKSTLIANWVAALRKAKPDAVVIEHYLGASPDSAEPRLVMRRIVEHLARAIGETEPLPDPDSDLMATAAAFAQILARVGAFAERRAIDIVIALDGLDKLAGEQNLRWLPRVLPPRVRLLASSLEGEALRAADARGWRRLDVKPLSEGERARFIESLLGAWGRKLSAERIARIVSHPLAGIPLFLKTVLEELRYSAINERLDARIDFYLGAADMPDLFARVLERLEEDSPFVARALAPVWASRAGLEEADIIAVSGAQPLAWATIRNGLGDALRDQQGRIAFSHDFLRHAVAARYLPGEDAQKAVHLALADHFERGLRDARQAEELPYQLRAAQAWERLENLLADLDRFALLRGRGDVELLGYWLPLAECGRDPETLLCAAFTRRPGSPSMGELSAAQRLTEGVRSSTFPSLPPEPLSSSSQPHPLSRASRDSSPIEGEQRSDYTLADCELASALGEFLEVAGARGRAVQELGEKRTAAYERLLGAEHPDTLTSVNNLAQTLLARGDLEGAEAQFARVFDARTRLLGAEHKDALSSLNNLAQAVRQRGDLAQAQTLQQRAVDAATRVIGTEQSDTLTYLNNLADILSERGDLEGAQKLFERTFEASTRQLGPEHPDTLSAGHNLAGALKARGDLAGAQALCERVLDARMRLLGPEHPNTLISVTNLASTLIARGDPAGAQALQQRVLDAAARLAGPDHPDTLVAMNNLAQTISDRGDFAAAQALFRRALASMARVHGAEHPTTLAAMNNLAQTLKAGGDLTEALRLEQALLDARLRVSGPEHPMTLTVMSNLAQTRLASGDLDGALDLSQRAMEGSARKLGEDHPETLTTAHNYASALLARGDLERAQEVFERVVDSRTRLLGAEHADTLSVLDNLAQARQARGDPQGGRALHERVRDARLRLLGPEHPDTLSAMSNLAGAMRACGDLAGAQGLLEGVSEAMSRVLGPEHPTTLSSLINFAGALKARGDLGRAQQLEERALEARLRVSGPDHPDTLTTMNNLAQTMYTRGDAAGAQPLFERVLEGRRRVNGADHLDTLACVINLAQTRKAQSDIDGAQALEEEALEALIRTVGFDHPLTLTSMSNLVGTLRFRGDLEAAQQVEERALEARERLLGPEHPDTLTSMNALAEIRYGRGDAEGAHALLEPLVERRVRVLGADHPETLTSMSSLGSVVWARGDLAGAGALFARVREASAKRLGAEHALTVNAVKALAALEAVRAAN